MGIIVSILVLLLTVVTAMLFLARRKRQTPVAAVSQPQNQVPLMPPPDFTVPTNPYTPSTPVSAYDEHERIAARANWWLPDSFRKVGPVRRRPPGIDEPQDLFEEGRKRLEEEERQNQIPVLAAAPREDRKRSPRD